MKILNGIAFNGEPQAQAKLGCLRLRLAVKRE